ncbi:aldose 1-epimerase [Foetidibacter luteolus]|uniref:aldose 1-epimerase n=1 Tax=Foetidibacter luteolus TaxID=2608880 RepID=UPI00129A5CD6|nr:aldose 1-epimerase [Foetidibacter luteolus]
MAFKVSIEETDSSKVITLASKDGLCTAEIYSFGALLNAFTITNGNSTTNVIDGFASPADAKANITHGFKSAKLSPFVCRLEKAQYQFEGEEYSVKKFNLGSEAIHGLLFDAEYAVKEQGADKDKAFVVLTSSYSNKEQGFPFSYTAEVMFTLETGNRLTLTTRVINESDSNMPLSDGWHPYFKLGKSVNDLQVQFNTNTMVEFDERLLPSGNTLPDNRFENMVDFKDTFLDNCFVLKDHSAASCILQDVQQGLRLSIYASSSYPYLQVYTPPERTSIAVENLSSVPDAFNNGIGLIVSQPGDVHEFTTTYQLELI